MANHYIDIVDIQLGNGQIHRSYMNKAIGYGDSNANVFGVRAYRDGQPQPLTGSVSAYFIRHADGGTITIASGVVSGNLAYVTLPAACYALEGNFSLAIKITGDGSTTTLRIVDGTVSRTETGAAVDPGTIIPSIDQLIDMINQAVASIPSDYSVLNDRVKMLEAQDPNVDSLDDFSDELYYDTTGAMHAGSATTWKSTPLKPCKGYRAMHFKLYKYISNSTKIASIAFFSESGTFLSAFDPYYLTNGQGNFQGWCTIPDNAVFYRAVTFFNASNVNHEVTLHKEVAQVALQEYYTNETTLYNHDGTEYHSTGTFYSTYFIPVSGFKSVTYQGWGFNSAGYTLETVTFFNASLQRIGGVFAAVAPNTSLLMEGTAPIPDGAKWVKLFYRNDLQTFSLAFNNPEGTLCNVMCIGDSITEGITYQTDHVDYKYPQLMQEKLGLGYTVFNAGIGGITAATWWSQARYSQLDVSMTDVFIIMLGLNGGMTDTFETDVDPYNNYQNYRNTITGCTCKMIEWIQAQRPEALVIFATPTYASKTTPNETAAESQIACLPKLQARYNLPIIDVRNMMGVYEKNIGTFLSSDKVHGKQNFYYKLAEAMYRGLMAVKNIAKEE